MTWNEGYVFRERIEPADGGRTLLDHLTRSWPHSTEAEWRERIESGRVRLDDRVVDPDAAVQEGQLLTWTRPPWREPPAPSSFEVLYEDAHLLAVAKPAGLPTLPGGGFLKGTLLSLVQERDVAAVPVHRLGRWTSGLVLCARTAGARTTLAEAWRSQEVRKVYRALCSGVPDRERFAADTPIGPVPHALLGTVHAATPDGKPAHSEFSVIERREASFLADVEIRTGRPHQVRIHAAAAGYPLVGDPLYEAGGRPRDGSTALPGDPGYRLHASRLCLRHPETREELDLRCEPPAELSRAADS